MIDTSQRFQTSTVNMKQIIAEKRNLEKIIEDKNKEIEALNLRIEKMYGLHKRDL